MERKSCHWCKKNLEREMEDLFLHCYECCLRRLESLSPTFDPCPVCSKRKDEQ